MTFAPYKRPILLPDRSAWTRIATAPPTQLDPSLGAFGVTSDSGMHPGRALSPSSGHARYGAAWRLVRSGSGELHPEYRTRSFMNRPQGCGAARKWIAPGLG